MERVNLFNYFVNKPSYPSEWSSFTLKNDKMYFNHYLITNIFKIARFVKLYFFVNCYLLSIGYKLNG